MKYIIINADDFGMSKGTNEGIIECFKNGILTSASLMTDGFGYDDAVDKIKKYLDSKSGVHLNISAYLKTSKILNVHFLADYFKENILKIKNQGISITHIDFHKHLILVPTVFYAFNNLNNFHKINYYRISFEKLLFKKIKSYKNINSKNLVLSILSQFGFIYKILLNSKINFTGMVETGDWTIEKLLFLFENLPDGITEIMFHPGYVDDDLLRFDGKARLKLSREDEIKILTSSEIKNYINKNRNIKLIGWHHLNLRG